MKKLVLVAALAAIVALPLNAMAAYYTLSVGQIQAMAVYDTDGDAGTAHLATTYLPNGAKFSGTIRNNNPGFGWVDYYVQLGGMNLSAYDGFGLCLENVNENPWDLGVWAQDFDYNTIYYGQPEVPINTPTYITLDWAWNGSFDATSVWEVGFFVEDQVPNAGTDYVYEVNVAPLPEPGTLALFGFGLAGAAASYRRKRAAKKA